MWNSLLWWAWGDGFVTHKAFVPRTVAFWAHLKKKKKTVSEKSIVPSQRWYYASPTSDSRWFYTTHRFRYSTKEEPSAWHGGSYVIYVLGKEKKRQTFSESEVLERGRRWSGRWWTTRFDHQWWCWDHWPLVTCHLNLDTSLSLKRPNNTNDLFNLLNSINKVLYPLSLFQSLCFCFVSEEIDLCCEWLMMIHWCQISHDAL